MLKFGKQLDSLCELIREIMETQYIPFLNSFLMKMHISCLSASGWNNKLMWAHYANSYCGICIEYDFNKLERITEIIRKVKYSDERAIITLKDLGITGLQEVTGEKHKFHFQQTVADMDKILDCLVTKDKCWNYEKEWRLIQYDDSDADSYFFKSPCIKSITLGLNVDYLCKRLILDVCKEKGIECYQLKLEHDNFKISREKIDMENIEYDEQVELDYIQLLSEDIVHSCESIVKLSNDIIPEMKNGGFNGLALKVILEKILSYLEGVYFLKLAYNRFCSNLPESTDVPSDIQENIGQFEITTKTIHESILEWTNIIQQALASGHTGSDTHNDYMKTFGTVQDIYEKCQSLHWYKVL